MTFSFYQFAMQSLSVKMKSFVLLMTLGFAYAIDLKVDNNCPFPIWLATLPNFGQNPLPDGVRQLNTGASYTYNVNIF